MILTTGQDNASARQRETVILFAAAHVPIHKEVCSLLRQPIQIAFSSLGFLGVGNEEFRRSRTDRPISISQKSRSVVRFIHL